MATVTHDVQKANEISSRVCDDFKTWKSLFRQYLKRNKSQFKQCEDIATDLSKLWDEGRIDDNGLIEIYNNSIDLHKINIVNKTNKILSLEIILKDFINKNIKNIKIIDKDIKI